MSNLVITNFRCEKKILRKADHQTNLRIVVISFLFLFGKTGTHAHEAERLSQFNLPGIDGKFYKLEDFDNGGNIGIVFLSNHCRTSQKFQKSLIKIKDWIDGSEHNFFAVSPNHEKAILPAEEAYSDLGDSLLEMSIRAKNENYNFQYLYDGEKQLLTKKFAVVTTPTALVFNKEKKLIFKGKIGNLKDIRNIKDLEFFKYLVADIDIQDIKTTKTFGTSVKSKMDGLNFRKSLTKHSKETVRLSYGDKEKIDFLLNFKFGKLKLFYFWKFGGKENLENLVKLSSIHKIYRKRGLNIITICKEESKNFESVLTKLQNSQLSSYNYIMKDDDLRALTRIAQVDLEQEIPILLAIDDDNKEAFRSVGNIDRTILRRKIVLLLDK